MNTLDDVLLGALVADAASLGLHWLYDPVRIAEIEARDGLSFLAPNAAHYADTKGYFAHGAKQTGDLSGYGEVCLLMLRHLARHGEFKRIEYQSEYRAHFGPGGGFVGYIDSPTRLTLRTLLPLEPAVFPTTSGPDDDQHPALAALPALVATHSASREELRSRVEAVVRITNNNDVAVCAAQCMAQLLFDVMHGSALPAAMNDALPLAGPVLQPLLEQSLATTSFDAVAVGERFGRACHVPHGLPVMFHILQHAGSYREGVEANIRCGGDSCGRAIMLGAILAAVEPDAVPLEWIARLSALRTIADSLACARRKTK